MLLLSWFLLLLLDFVSAKFIKLFSLNHGEPSTAHFLAMGRGVRDSPVLLLSLLLLLECARAKKN